MTQDYIYAIGRIRALERFLISKEVFTKAIDSSLNEALRLFTEADPNNSELLHADDAAKIEEALSRQTIKLKGLIKGLLLDEKFSPIIDKAGLKDFCLAAAAAGSAFLKEYFLYLIDMHNIKTFLRLYLLKEPETMLQSAITCEGFIKKKSLLQAYTHELAFFFRLLEYVHKQYCVMDYMYSLGEAIRKTTEERSFLYLEKAINDFLIEALKPAKYICFGPEPLLAYYFAKTNEINLIRMIILAKLDNIAQDAIKTRFNVVYA